ncbi:hypothetical protein Pmani_017486 [Petrolisthes manimaculis]|uniref:Uncharacterized protein n=1 Tax=Petrolisthes manimaculis TaxID=1843537 RepID=A0AAE1PPN3_9EUCA|nr:hypothetical protein Pmani_017486 [Petrolisthes manimaculis]
MVVASLGNQCAEQNTKNNDDDVNINTRDNDVNVNTTNTTAENDDDVNINTRDADFGHKIRSSLSELSEGFHTNNDTLDTVGKVQEKLIQHLSTRIHTGNPRVTRKTIANLTEKFPINTSDKHVGNTSDNLAEKNNRSDISDVELRGKTSDSHVEGENVNNHSSSTPLKKKREEEVMEHPLAFLEQNPDAKSYRLLTPSNRGMEIEDGDGREAGKFILTGESEDEEAGETGLILDELETAFRTAYKFLLVPSRKNGRIDEDDDDDDDDDGDGDDVNDDDLHHHQHSPSPLQFLPFTTLQPPSLPSTITTSSTSLISTYNIPSTTTTTNTTLTITIPNFNSPPPLPPPTTTTTTTTTWTNLAYREAKQTTQGLYTPPDKDYHFSYTVGDPRRLLHFGHHEEREGGTEGTVYGQYHVRLPNGVTQVS